MKTLKIEVDFIPASSRKRILGWLLLGASIIFWGVELAIQRHYAEMADHVNSEIARLSENAQLNEIASRDIDPGQEKARVKISGRWSHVLDALERSDDDVVQLKFVRIDVAAEVLEFAGTANSSSAAYEYMSRLQLAPELMNVELLNLQVEQGPPISGSFSGKAKFSVSP